MFTKKLVHDFATIDCMSGIYICEQNDPCSGCYTTRLQNTLRFAFTSVSMACNRSAIDFPCVGALEPNIAFGSQSLEIQRGV